LRDARSPLWLRLFPRSWPLRYIIVMMI
jgi:hypothetical protein